MLVGGGRHRRCACRSGWIAPSPVLPHRCFAAPPSELPSGWERIHLRSASVSGCANSYLKRDRGDCAHVRE
eukprot:432168-Rhodomonas_salina.1